MKKLRTMYQIVSLVVAAVILGGCKAQASATSITAVGSSALQPLVEAAADRYVAHNKTVFVNVQGGGSGTGLSQIQAGAVQIGNSDVYAEQKSGIDAHKLKEHKVAVVGIVPIVNRHLKINNLTFSQLQQIFAGTITNWSQVGGPDLPITIVNRAQGSGTRLTFEDLVMKGRAMVNAQEQDSTGMVRKLVASSTGAISYIAFPYIDGSIKTLEINGVSATNANVMTDKWTLWSYEHMYTRKKPNALTKKFVQYVLSEKIQHSLVRQMGYIPIMDMQVTRQLNGDVQRRK